MVLKQKERKCSMSPNYNLLKNWGCLLQGRHPFHLKYRKLYCNINVLNHFLIQFWIHPATTLMPGLGGLSYRHDLIAPSTQVFLYIPAILPQSRLLLSTSASGPQPLERSNQPSPRSQQSSAFSVILQATPHLFNSAQATETKRWVLPILNQHKNLQQCQPFRESQGNIGSKSLH